MSVGIVGYGMYVPETVIPVEFVDPRATHLGLVRKSVASWDEDSVTMAVEAGRTALHQARVSPWQVGAVYVGSESPPYAVNPSSTIIADVLGLGNEYGAVDLQFACKAASAGLLMASAQVEQRHMDYSLVVGSDTSQARQGDVLEWSAGAAAAAVVIGRNNVVAEMLTMASVSSDTPDFWRRSEERYPSHGGRFTGEEGYFSHVMAASSKAMKNLSLRPDDFDHVVFHMPNGLFPEKAARRLGFSPTQLAAGMSVVEVGNPYAAATLLGLTCVLDISKPGDLVLMTSYGSGAGADSIVWRVTKKVSRLARGRWRRLLASRKYISREEYVDRVRWE